VTPARNTFLLGGAELHNGDLEDGKQMKIGKIEILRELKIFLFFEKRGARGGNGKEIRYPKLRVKTLPSAG
jgi:hypothetical protein